MRGKRFVLSVLFILGFSQLGLYAQESQIATGSEASGTGGTTSYTVGQVMYTTAVGNTGSVAQGVQHAFEVTVSTGEELNEIAVSFSAYPNPTWNVLNLSIGNYKSDKLRYQLFDLQGKLIETKLITDPNTRITMAGLATATYFLKILHNNQPIKSFSIIKR